jgi:hypothetical protein
MKSALLLLLSLAACGGPSRFALRGPVLRDPDEAPLSHAPPKNEEIDGANAVDVVFLRPLAHAFTPDLDKEASNVNSLDEVPDSSWFTNRRVAPAQMERGPCVDGASEGSTGVDDLPVFPVTIRTTKTAGVTPGFVVHDKRHKKFVLKVDELAHYGQDEISTAADAIVSRLYWAVGFNAPCNNVVEISPDDLRLDARSEEILTTGRHKPLTEGRLKTMLKQATHAANGKLRMSTSRFIEGQGVGVWTDTGLRRADPNDRIPHENRRELRGERVLAGWVAHWDSRDQNTYDSFIPSSSGGGYVRHYFLDFSDAIGGTISRTRFSEPRSGHEVIISVPNMALDAATFGVRRRPWDDVKVDPRYPNLGFLDVDHFDPMGFVAQTSLVRWAHAQRTDLAWMARRIAMLDEEHVRTAVDAGHFTHPTEQQRLVEILMGRRARILRAAFATTSPLGDVSVAGGRLCMVDWARYGGISSDAATSYAIELRSGRHLALAPLAPRSTRTEHGICVDMPPHFAPNDVPMDSVERYATIDIIRFAEDQHTRLRAHFYDLGPRGFALVGIERP